MGNMSLRQKRIKQLQEQQNALKKGILGTSRTNVVEESPILLSAFSSVSTERIKTTRPTLRERKMMALRQQQRGMKLSKPKNIRLY